MSDIDEQLAFQTSSPHSLRQEYSPHHQDDGHDYNFSGIIYDEPTDDAPSTDEEEHLPLSHDHELLRPASTRVSSVSSFPASVIHHTPIDEEPRTPSKTFFNYGQDRTTTPTSQPPRAHSTGFRHPSSVRALQMRDEFELSELDGLTWSRRRDSRMSFFSHRSSGSAPNSPAKRTSRSSNSSPLKSNTKTKLRKEFPLVLLHCTLLPPALVLRASQLSDSILEAIIPPPYSQRWKILQEKVVRNTEVKARGVLIPHPRDEYELLEEKLLESLDLERPRLRDGHFLAAEGRADAIDSGFESASSSDQAEDGDMSERPDTCPDCGKCVSCDTEAQRKWEIKVFAANGLLRSSAWSAAWQEMEKVDVEISVWMPENVRREVDSRIEVLLEQEKAEKKTRRRERKQADDERLREIYGSDPPKSDDATRERTQDEIDGLFDDHQHKISGHATNGDQMSGEPSSTSPDSETEQTNQPAFQSSKPDPRLMDALVTYIRLLAQDRRNIAIFLLSMLVLFYGMNQPNRIPATAIVDSNILPIQDIQITSSQALVTSVGVVAITDSSTLTKPTSTASSKSEEVDLETFTVLPEVMSGLVSAVQTDVPCPTIIGGATESDDDGSSDIQQDEPAFIAFVPVTEDQEVCRSPLTMLETAAEQGQCMATSTADIFMSSLDQKR